VNPLAGQLRELWRKRQHLTPSSTALLVMALAALAYPETVWLLSPSQAGALTDQAADAGVYVLMAIGLNVVIGFAGLLDLGYAAFFAIGAYSAALLASPQLGQSPLHYSVHVPFWILLLVGVVVAGVCGALLGAPTLRLRGDYLAIVTFGFGEIVPRVFRNLSDWTGGVNGVGAIDAPTLPAWVTGPWVGVPFGVVRNFPLAFNPTAYYVVIVVLVATAIIIVYRLLDSPLGRAWQAIREDETAAAAMGINTVVTKLLAFAIGASFSGFAGVYYGTKLGIVSPDSFSFTVSATILLMIVFGGIGNIAGVVVGALALYFVLFNFLTNLPNYASGLASSLGLDAVVQANGAWPGIAAEVQRLNFLLYGLILLVVMLRRPAGLIPNRIRRRELRSGDGD
jgi:branched-chain amino acid transport system permease protein